MKKIMYFSAAVCALVSFASCNEKEPVDIDIVGDLTLSAELSGKQLDVHGSWAVGDKLGVYVLSDGFDQDNLPYSATEEAASSLLQADGTAAGYKAGKHTIYAYYPYSEASKSVKAVALPDMSRQTLSPTDVGYYPDNTIYAFAYGSTEYDKEYSVAEVAIGKLNPIFDWFTVLPLSLPAGLVGKDVPEITISSDIKFAYKNAKINLTNGEISGELVNEIKIIPNGTFYAPPKCGYCECGMFKFACLSEEALEEAGLLLKFTVDGVEYVFRGENTEVSFDSVSYMQFGFTQISPALN